MKPVTKAAAAGHLTAMNNLANLYAWGQGTKPDIRKARQLFSQASKNGSVLAAGNLSDFADYGRDDTKRLEKLRAVPLVQALGISFTVSTVTLAMALSHAGEMTTALVWPSVVGFIVAAIGMALGQLVRGLIKPETFRLFFFIGLLMLGVHLALRGLL